MKLVFVTQTLDPAHGSLAQTLDLVRALAGRADHVVVLCRTVDWDEIPANVEVRTFDARSKIGRAATFERELADALSGADAVLVHMVPTFLALAAPLARARRVPLLLWYTHWHASRSLRLATRLADAVLSVDTTSFPLQTSKLRAIGHAIDVDVFVPPSAARGDGPIRLLALGRTARWKGLGTLLDAFARLDGRRGARDPWAVADAGRGRASRRVGGARPGRRPCLRRARDPARRGTVAPRGCRRRRQPRGTAAPARPSTRPSTRPPPARDRS